jgi:hypothetical protein
MRCTCDELLNDGPAACEMRMRGSGHNGKRVEHSCCCSTWGPGECLSKDRNHHDCACELLLCDAEICKSYKPCMAKVHKCICETITWVGPGYDCMAPAEKHFDRTPERLSATKHSKHASETALLSEDWCVV